MLKLEMGKKYITRGGPIATIQKIDTTGKHPVVYGRLDNSERLIAYMTWTHDGRFSVNHPNDVYDIVDEVKERKWYQKIKNKYELKQAVYLFCLTRLEGKLRNYILGLTDEHYENEELARKWYIEILRYVHPDKGGNNHAFRELIKIYDVLTKGSVSRCIDNVLHSTKDYKIWE